MALSTDQKINETHENTLSILKEMADMRKTITELMLCNSTLQGRCEALEKRVKEQEEKINDLEQYGRRNSLRIFGVTEKKNETLADIDKTVIQLAKESLNITLKEEDIDIAHRVGKVGVNKTRPIIVKFIRRNLRNKVLAARRRLKGSKKTIVEDLTIQNLKLYNTVRGHSNVQQTWTRNGVVYALTYGGVKLKIDPTIPLDRQIETPNTSSEESPAHSRG